MRLTRLDGWKVREGVLANGGEAHRRQFMARDREAQIDKAVAKRRTALETSPLHEVRHEFQFAYQIYPDSHSSKENLIERILVKIRAELECHS